MAEQDENVVGGASIAEDLPDPVRDNGDDSAIEVDFTEEIREPLKMTFVEDDDDTGVPPIAAEYVSPVEPPVVDENRAKIDRFIAEVSRIGTNERLTVIAYRLPDPKHIAFRIPWLDARQHWANVDWDGDSVDDFHTYFASLQGGGLYDFQIRDRSGFTEHKWQALIVDPAEASVRERTELAAKSGEHERSVSLPQSAAATPPVSPFEEMKNRLREAKEIKELLTDAAPVQPGSSLSADDQIKLELYKNLAGKSEFQEKLIDYGFGLFPTEKEKEKATNVWDVAKAAAQDPQGTIQLVAGTAQLIASLLKPFLGGGQTSAPVNRTSPAAAPPVSTPSGPRAAAGSAASNVVDFVPPGDEPSASGPQNAATGQQTAGIGIADELPKAVEWD